MIRLLVMDVDGTLTDGKIYMGNDGELFKAFDIKDGCGIHDLLKPNGIEPVIITGRKSKIVENRAKEIGIDWLFQGVADKIKKLNYILEEKGLNLSNVAYVGDDINDLECVKHINEAGGLTACPYDAIEEVKKNVKYICKRKGGEGAVRDFIEWLIKKEKKENLSKKVSDAISYVENLELDTIPTGRYEISEGTYFMVQEYITKKEQHCKLESHKNYIDVQWILNGKEKIKTYPVNYLDPETTYDAEKDVVFWRPVDDMRECVLTDGGYVVLYPNDAHMPCIAVNEQSKVRKVVIKVKV